MNIKSIIAIVTVFIFITLLIPTMLVLPFKEEVVSGKLTDSDEDATEVVEPITPAVSVAVYRAEKQEIEQLPLETYVVGVVASEMPATFEMEALKAQALAARTYIVKQLTIDDKIGLPEGAVVTDTQLHQVFKNNEDLKHIWGKEYETKLAKITQAVQMTAGKILTYEGEPITAQYFSTSNGYTENSEAYWSNPFAYLTTVASPWDEASPKFYDKKIFSIPQFEQLLGIKVNGAAALGEVVERTPGKRIGKITVAGKTFTGREIREKLQLRSADFQWVRKGDNIVVETKGYGHGVGMSQYGANGMALEGKTYADIVTYYYQGVAISNLDGHLTKTVVKK